MKKIVGVVCCIVIIAIIAFEGYTIWRLNNQIKEKDNTINTIKNETSLEDKIKDAYAKKMENEYNISSGDYRIDRVEILNDEDKKSVLEMDNGQYYKEGDVLAVITYAEKAEYGMAGNGVQDGDWVVNKEACVAYRDGKIVSDGTGW